MILNNWGDVAVASPPASCHWLLTRPPVLSSEECASVGCIMSYKPLKLLKVLGIISHMQGSHAAFIP